MYVAIFEGLGPNGEDHFYGVIDTPPAGSVSKEKIHNKVYQILALEDVVDNGAITPPILVGVVDNIKTINLDRYLKFRFVGVVRTHGPHSGFRLAIEY